VTGCGVDGQVPIPGRNNDYIVQRLILSLVQSWEILVYFYALRMKIFQHPPFYLEKWIYYVKKDCKI
jgi:hypothetical protein